MSDWIPSSIYKTIIERVPIVCVDLAIVHDGKILLVKRGDPPCKDQWWLPGGRVRKGEKMRDAALRKATEEVGLQCHAGPILHTAETIFPDGPHDIAVHSVNVCYLMFPIPGLSDKAVDLDSHHQAFRWVDHIPPGSHPYVTACLEKSGIFDEDAAPQTKPKIAVG